jgi:hypothetical protein
MYRQLLNAVSIVMDTTHMFTQVHQVLKRAETSTVYNSGKFKITFGISDNLGMSGKQLTECKRKQVKYTRAHICKRLRSPRIDSEKSIPLAYVAWQAGTTH